MPSQPLSLLDPDRIAALANRQSIFLDSSIWIDLSDAHSAEAMQAKTLLKELVSSGVAFCPVSITNLLELFLQNHDSALREAELMDELSLNVTFRIREEIVREELRAFLSSFCGDTIRITQDSLSYADLFASAAAFLGSKLTLEYPEATPIDFIDDASRKLEDHMKHLGIAGIVNLLKARLPMDDWKRDFPSQMSAEVLKERRAASKGSKRQARQIERRSVLERELVPKLSDGIAQCDPLARPKLQRMVDGYVLALADEAAEVLLRKLPCLYRYVEVLTAIGLDDSMKLLPNHFIDTENMIVPSIYADVFVARDKWVKAVMLDSNIEPTNRATCLFSLSELISHYS